MFEKTRMFINKYKIENLARHNLNCDVINNSNIKFIKDKMYLDGNYKDLNINKKDIYNKRKKANTKPKKIK